MSSQTGNAVQFQLRAHDRRLEVRATVPGGGEGWAETDIPAQDILDRLATQDPASRAPSVLKSIGKALHECLMCGDVAELASHVLRTNSRLKRAVHFELQFHQDQTLLARYPWELVVDDQDRFLVRDGLVDLTRYIMFPQPPPFLDAAIKELPLLRVVAQPANLPSLSPIELALEHIEMLAPATFEQLQKKLIVEHMRLWGFHFDGHGGLVLQCQQCGAFHSLDSKGRCSTCGALLAKAQQLGALAFEHNGGVDWITADQLASVLFSTNVQLAVLLACETARVGSRHVFSGVAPGLILAGVPAVIGLQYPVSDDFANSFVNAFYRALVQPQNMQDSHPQDIPEASLLDAFRIARQMNAWGAWYCPVLYLRHKRSVQPVYETRHIDTAVPGEIPVGMHVVGLLWIRRPETKRLTEQQLRKMLGIAEEVPVETCETEAEVKFEPVEGRALRRGEVEVQLSSPCCDVSPESIALPVDEHLDAPKVFFVILARKLGRVPLIFSVWQDGVQIAAVTHFIQVVSASQQARPIIKTESHALSVEERELVKPAKPDSFEIPEMHLRRDGTVVVVGQRERRRIKLHGNELDLLRHLYRRSGEIVPRKTLVERVLDEVYVPGDRAQYQRLNRLIAGLRDKLELKRDRPFVVQTVRGRGYRLDARVTRFTRRGSITRSRAKRMRTDKSSDLLH